MEVALIVAGGKGLRLPGDTPKQFIEIAGLPVLMHTINAFRGYSPTIQILLVLPAMDVSRWEHLCHQYRFEVKITVVTGGATRFDSVRNGLEKVSGAGEVAVHDGVRPLITPEIIAASFEMARKYRSAVASVALKESIREMSGSISSALGNHVWQNSVSVDRGKFRLMQTPQTFDIQLLKSAYEAASGNTFTDDASVVESAGHAITLFEGSYENLKITTPEDLVVAEAMLKRRMRNVE
jgi:2-C-methyl-D-erythritol 4-phosphate cytidylyltransferase